MLHSLIKSPLHISVSIGSSLARTTSLPAATSAIAPTVIWELEGFLASRVLLDRLSDRLSGVGAPTSAPVLHLASALVSPA